MLEAQKEDIGEALRHLLLVEDRRKDASIPARRTISAKRV